MHNASKLAADRANAGFAMRPAQSAANLIVDNDWPRGPSDCAFRLRDLAAVEMAVLMEVVVDRGVSGRKFR